MVKKYVVVHSSLGTGHTRGQVVEDKALGEGLQRFLDLGAVREATGEEAKHEQVTLEEPSGGVRQASHEQQMAQVAADRDLLRARVQQLEAELSLARKEAAEMKQNWENLQGGTASLQERQAAARPPGPPAPPPPHPAPHPPPGQPPAPAEPKPPKPK
jgi:hypothetical protein